MKRIVLVFLSFFCLFSVYRHIVYGQEFSIDGKKTITPQEQRVMGQKLDSEYRKQEAAQRARELRIPDAVFGKAYDLVSNNKETMFIFKKGENEAFFLKLPVHTTAFSFDDQKYEMTIYLNDDKDLTVKTTPNIGLYPNYCDSCPLPKVTISLVKSDTKYVNVKQIELYITGITPSDGVSEPFIKKQRVDVGISFFEFSNNFVPGPIRRPDVI